MDMPLRGETYNGPDGPVEVLASDGAFEGTVTVQPKGGGEERKVPLAEWRRDYVYAHPGAETGAVAERAKEGFDGSKADEGVQSEGEG